MCFACNSSTKGSDIPVEEITNEASKEERHVNFDSTMVNKKKETPSDESLRMKHRTKSTKDCRTESAKTSVHFPLRTRTIKSSTAMLKGMRKELLDSAF